MKRNGCPMVDIEKARAPMTRLDHRVDVSAAAAMVVLCRSGFSLREQVVMLRPLGGV